MNTLKLNLKTLAALLPMLLILSAVTVRADAPAVLGTWDCVSETPDGDQIKWSLTIKDESGTLTGVAGGDQGDMPVKDLKVEGNDVSFKVEVEENIYEVTFTVNGSACEGKWSGAGATGTLKGTKRT